MTDVLQLLREDLLAGRTVATAGPARPELSEALTALGATVSAVTGEDVAGPVDALVVDAAALFAAAEGGDELAPLRAATDGTWATVRAVANTWIEPKEPGGKVVVLAPGPGAGPHAHATRAALENLARTLSIEWSRFGIRTTTITPGERTAPAEEAALVAYLLSPAGDYFSGARLDLSGG